jgi:UDP-glucoronosyl and UDP-glucosyl transferase
MHGVMEAIYHAVPMVGMPVFIDQVSWIFKLAAIFYIFGCFLTFIGVNLAIPFYECLTKHQG